MSIINNYDREKIDKNLRMQRKNYFTHHHRNVSCILVCITQLYEFRSYLTISLVPMHIVMLKYELQVLHQPHDSINKIDFYIAVPLLWGSNLFSHHTFLQVKETRVIVLLPVAVPHLGNVDDF